MFKCQGHVIFAALPSSESAEKVTGLNTQNVTIYHLPPISPIDAAYQLSCVLTNLYGHVYTYSWHPPVLIFRRRR